MPDFVFIKIYARWQFEPHWKLTPSPVRPQNALNATSWVAKRENLKKKQNFYVDFLDTL